MTSVLWFRRDLRLRDNPALHEAAGDGPVVALFVLDPALLKPAGAPRIAFLYRSLRALDEDLRSHGGRLIVRRGDPVNVVPKVVKEANASAVHVTGDFGPYGSKRDEAVEKALGDDVRFVRTGSPYAVTPGQLAKKDGEVYKVYTPYYRAWKDRGWHSPATTISGRVDWHTDVRSDDIPKDPELPATLELPDAGEDAARKTWKKYHDNALKNYGDERDRPDLDSTSHMSMYLKWGAIHPRTILADLGPGDDTYRGEIAWRDFYATILATWPESAREYFNPELAGMDYARADTKAFEAWTKGETGFPIVDAGMRQLLAVGWIHNRVRMIVASFLVKDLHIEWQHGARHFMKHLVDGDLASNQHGWQWVAGSGTDAAPYFRIFNPITQGQKFDPNGDYVRRWIPELREVEGKQAHTPWELDAPPPKYPEPIVDHKKERQVALDRYQAARAHSSS